MSKTLLRERLLSGNLFRQSKGSCGLASADQFCPLGVIENNSGSMSLIGRYIQQGDRSNLTKTVSRTPPPNPNVQRHILGKAFIAKIVLAAYCCGSIVLSADESFFADLTLPRLRSKTTTPAIPITSSATKIKDRTIIRSRLIFYSVYT
jgi:hypothetical protein